MKNQKHFKQRGQSLVEMGLFLMILLWLLAGAVDFGIAFFSFVAMRDAAQEGAIYGCIYPPYNATAEAKIIARVRNSSTDAAPINLASTSVTVTAPGGTDAGDPLTVLVEYNYPISMPLMSLITGPTIPLKASATSVILVNRVTLVNP